MNRLQIVAEISVLRSTMAATHQGCEAFERTTGLRKSDWYHHLWLRWGDALVEAGYAPNTFQTKTTTKGPY